MINVIMLYYVRKSKQLNQMYNRQDKITGLLLLELLMDE
jgi:hypothetical protein